MADPIVPDSTTPTPPEAPTPTPVTAPEATQPAPSVPPVDPGMGGSSVRRSAVLGLLLVAVAGAAVYGVGTFLKPEASKSTAIARKDIPLLRVSPGGPLSAAMYPNISPDSNQVEVNTQIFEGLVAFSEETKIVPLLATSWTTPTPTTWVFKLKTDVKFHTGTVMSAKHVKASLEAAKASQLGQVFSGTIKQVDVVDPATVKITTSAPDPLLLNELASLYVFDTDSTKVNDGVNGTGPYAVTSATDALVKLKAFDGYHGGHVYTRELDYVQAAEDPKDVVGALEKGSIDVATDLPDVENAKLAKGRYTSTVFPLYGTSHFVFNTRRPGPLTKKAVRLAVAAAIDRATINAKRLDFNPATYKVADQVVPVGIPGNDPSIKGPVYDPATAKKLLTDAGYPNGFKMKITYYPSTQKIIDEVTPNLAAVGITVVPDPQSDIKQLIDIAVGGKTDMYFNQVQSSIVDASDILSDFIDAPNYKNSQLTTLNTQAASTLDAKKRLALLQEMSRLVADDRADIPMYSNLPMLVTHPKNVVLRRDSQSGSIGVYFAKVYQK